MDGFGRGPKKGQPLEQDYHRVAAAMLTGEGTSAYNKTLASNNVLPPSIELSKTSARTMGRLERKNGHQLRRAQAKEGGGGEFLGTVTGRGAVSWGNCNT